MVDQYYLPADAATGRMTVREELPHCGWWSP